MCTQGSIGHESTSSQYDCLDRMRSQISTWWCQPLDRIFGHLLFFPWKLNQFVVQFFCSPSRCCLSLFPPQNKRNASWNQQPACFTLRLWNLEPCTRNAPKPSTQAAPKEIKMHMWAELKPNPWLTFHYYWLVYRDPYIGLLQSLY